MFVFLQHQVQQQPHKAVLKAQLQVPLEVVQLPRAVQQLHHLQQLQVLLNHQL